LRRRYCRKTTLPSNTIAIEDQRSGSAFDCPQSAGLYFLIEFSRADPIFSAKLSNGHRAEFRIFRLNIHSNALLRG
jgi:hypothetical protein